MAVTLRPAFQSSIQIVAEPTPTLKSSATAIDHHEPKSSSPVVDQPKTWPVLTPTSGLRTQLAADPKLFGAYLKEAVDANQTYFFPAKLGEHAVYGERARAFFKEAIDLAQQLYPSGEQARSPARDQAFAAIDDQVTRVHEAVYGSKVYATDGSVAWTSTCHWPTSPVHVAIYEEDRNRYLASKSLHGELLVTWLDMDLDGRILPLRHSEATDRHLDKLRRIYANSPEMLEMIERYPAQANAELHVTGPDFRWEQESPITWWGLCRGLDNLQALTDRYTGARDGAYFAAVDKEPKK